MLEYGQGLTCATYPGEYANRHPETDDLCPQANVSETLLGGYAKSPQAIADLTARTPRATVAGYLEARLNSPFLMINDVSPYVADPTAFNKDIPKNLRLVCGDNLLEILAEAIRQLGLPCGMVKGLPFSFL